VEGASWRIDHVQLPVLGNSAAPLIQTSHEKHTGVDDSPGQIAAERAEEHGPNLDGVCGHDAERQSRSPSRRARRVLSAAVPRPWANGPD
jgi:hypothetical protein